MKRNYYWSILLILFALSCSKKEEKSTKPFADAPTGAKAELIETPEQASGSVPTSGALVLSLQLSPSATQLTESESESECDAYGQDAGFFVMPCHLVSAMTDTLNIVGTFLDLTAEGVTPVFDGEYWVFENAIEKPEDQNDDRFQFFTYECQEGSSAELIETANFTTLYGKMKIKQNANGSVDVLLGAGFDADSADQRLGMISANWFVGVEENTGKGQVDFDWQILSEFDGDIYQDAGISDIENYCNAGLEDGEDQWEDEGAGTMTIVVDTLTNDSSLGISFSEDTSMGDMSADFQWRKDSSEFQFRLAGVQDNMAGPGDEISAFFDDASKGSLSEKLVLSVAYNGDEDDFRAEGRISVTEGDRADAPIEFKICSKFEENNIINGFAGFERPSTFADQISEYLATSEGQNDPFAQIFSAENEAIYCPSLEWASSSLGD